MATGPASNRKSGGMRNDDMRKIALILAVLALAACNTVAGVGEDVSGGARTVQGWFGG